MTKRSTTMPEPIQSATALAPAPTYNRFVQTLVLGLFKLLYFYKADGQENLPPPGGPLILASNHASYFDPVFVALGQRRVVRFMAWAALFKGWFGRLITRWGAFPVDLDRYDPGAFRQALEVLRRGEWLVIFPEGGRTPDGKLMEMREGVARLSMLSGAPILPVRIDGAFEAWPKPKPLPYIFKRVRVHYGPMIHPPSERLRPEEREAAAAQMMENLRAFLEGPADRAQ